MPGPQAKPRDSLVNRVDRCLVAVRGRVADQPSRVSPLAVYGESDKIATLLTEDSGKLTGIAKGAKNSRRRFANSLEPLARVQVRFRQKPGASLAFLESCRAPRRRRLLRAGALRLRQLPGRAHRPDDGRGGPGPQSLTGSSRQALVELEQGPATTAFLRGFELQLLSGAGFGPQLAAAPAAGGRGPATSGLDRHPPRDGRLRHLPQRRGRHRAGRPAPSCSASMR